MPWQILFHMLHIVRASDTLKKINFPYIFKAVLGNYYVFLLNLPIQLFLTVLRSRVNTTKQTFQYFFLFVPLKCQAAHYQIMSPTDMRNVNPLISKAVHQNLDVLEGVLALCNLL